MPAQNVTQGTVPSRPSGSAAEVWLLRHPLPYIQRMPRPFVVLLSLLLAGPRLSCQELPIALKLRPGDVVRVQLVGETARSGDFVVDDRGFAVLPLLGRRVVTSSPWAQVRDSLYRDYSRELSGSGFSVTPMVRVFVLGSVTHQGIYFADPSANVAEAVALAGGAAAEGDLRRIRVVRDGVTLFERASIDAEPLQTGIRSGDQIFVDRRSWFDRNSPTAISALAGILGVIATVVLLR